MLARNLPLALCAWLAVAIPNPALAVGFLFETIDSGADVGQHNSMVLDSSGNEHIAYWDYFFTDLKYAHRSAGIWTIQTLDSADNVGQSPSIALDSSGNPGIAYLVIQTDPTLNRFLRYAKFDGISWSYASFDLTDEAGGWPSLQFDVSDRPQISHYDFTNQDLLYQYFDGVGWTIERVDSMGFVGGHSSMELDSSDEPHISYYDMTNEDLKYAFKSGGIWTIERVDSIGSVGGQSSLALDSSDTPHIAYYDQSVGSLKYAVREGGVWNSDYVLIGGERGINPALVLDAEDEAHITCHGGTDDDLWYVRRKDGSWQSAKVDSVNHKGFDSAIQLKPNELPVICYYDYTNGNLLFAEGVHPILVPDDFPTIQNAINAALFAGDSIGVQSGTHTGAGNRNLNFGGKDLVVFSSDGEFAATVDCQGLGAGFSFGSGETAASIVDGLRIEQSTDGAVVCTNSSSPTIRNCEITNISNGHGLRSDHSSPLVESCSIHDNFGSDFGIGMSVNSGAPTIRNSEFTLNQDLGFTALGGALSLQNTEAVVESCLFTINFSGLEGGAIYITGLQSPSILGCVFEGNHASAGPNTKDGGAIYSSGSAPRVSGCLFRGNHGKNGGAIALSNFGAKNLEIMIDECIFGANSASAAGGGLWIRGYVPRIQRCTIADNSAGTYGGGIHFADDDTCLVSWSIIWNNCATNAGDEVYFDENAGTDDVAVTFLCSDIDSTGFAGPGDWILFADNFGLDPMFIDPGSCPGFVGNDYGIDCNSPCQPHLSPCGVRIGAGAGACVVAVREEPAEVPEFALTRAIPNPFTGSTQIYYDVPRSAHVDLRVFDLRGRLVRELKSGFSIPGSFTAIWDGLDDRGRRVSPGIYFVRLRVGEEQRTTRTVLIRG